MTEKRRSVVITSSELEVLKAQARVCDSYIRTLAASDTRTARARLHQALGALARLKAAQQRDALKAAMDSISSTSRH